jgi:hypothetical protein
MTWPQYNALLVEQFAKQQLVSVPESKWNEFVDGLVSLGNFAREGVPNSRGFRSWQDWAQQYTGIMQQR